MTLQAQHLPHEGVHRLWQSRSKEQIQKIIDTYAKKIDEICRRKETEIMEV